MSFANCTMHEWNGHVEIFSRPQVIEISRQYLLLQTDILQAKVVGCPCWFCMKQTNRLKLCAYRPSSCLSIFFSYYKGYAL